MPNNLASPIDPYSHRWSEHTHDECPHCGKHTGTWPTTYDFAMLELCDCPHCGGRMKNSYIDGQFVWEKTRETPTK